MNISKMFYLILLSLLFSCSSNRYFLKNFEKEEVEFIPKWYKNSDFIRLGSGTSDRSFTITNHISSKKIEKIINKYQNKFKWIGIQRDSCAYILNSSYYFDLSEKTGCSEIIPIPPFIDEIRDIEEVNDWILPDDFIIYLLDYTDLKKMNNNGKSRSISKGIAISKKRKIIIYWIEKW